MLELTLATIRIAGSAEGSIIAAIITAHIRNTRATSAAPQPAMRGMIHMSAPASMFRMPQSIQPR